MLGQEDYMDHKHLLGSISFGFPVHSGGQGKAQSGVNGEQDKPLHRILKAWISINKILKLDQLFWIWNSR